MRRQVPLSVEEKGAERSTGPEDGQILREATPQQGTGQVVLHAISGSRAPEEAVRGRAPRHPRGDRPRETDDAHERKGEDGGEPRGSAEVAEAFFRGTQRRGTRPARVRRDAPRDVGQALLHKEGPRN